MIGEALDDSRNPPESGLYASNNKMTSMGVAAWKMVYRKFTVFSKYPTVFLELGTEVFR